MPQHFSPVVLAFSLATVPLQQSWDAGLYPLDPHTASGTAGVAGEEGAAAKELMKSITVTILAHPPPPPTFLSSLSLLLWWLWWWWWWLVVRFLTPSQPRGSYQGERRLIKSQVTVLFTVHDTRDVMVEESVS